MWSKITFRWANLANHLLNSLMPLFLDLRVLYRSSINIIFTDGFGNQYIYISFTSFILFFIFSVELSYLAFLPPHFTLTLAYLGLLFADCYLPYFFQWEVWSAVLSIVIAYIGFFKMQGWKISCFRHDSFSPENPLPLGHLLPEEPMKLELDKAAVVRNDWKTKCREVIFCLWYALLKMWWFFLLILIGCRFRIA